MRQHQDPDDFHDQDLDDDLGRPVYQGSGLTVRELDAEQLQRFLDAHAGQPARLLGSGWTSLDPPEHPFGGPRTPPGAGVEPLGPLAAVPAEPIIGSQGSPALRRCRVPPAARARAGRLDPHADMAGAAGRRRRPTQLHPRQPDRPATGRAGRPAVAALVGWRLRFRASEQARTWQRGAQGERHTARLLDRLTRDGYVVFHDLAVPDSPANVDCDDLRRGGHGEV